jgi:hypothetical protein
MSDYAFNKYQTVWFALHALLDEELSKEDQYTKDYVIDRLNDEFRFLYHEWPAVAEKKEERWKP